MQDHTALIGIFAALAVGAVSPGPSFLLVARIAVSSSQGAGLFAAVGIGAGGVVFAATALLGLHAVLLTVPSLYVGLKVLGGLYLIYLGIKIWRAADLPLSDSGRASRDRKGLSRSFAIAFATHVSNPKAAIVYASVFAAFLPPATTFTFNLILVGLVFLIEAGWYTLVALALSSATPRRVYLKYKVWLDRTTGGVMMALGIKLVTSVQKV